jgi:hypothetical protein
LTPNKQVVHIVMQLINLFGKMMRELMKFLFSFI